MEVDSDEVECVLANMIFKVCVPCGSSFTKKTLVDTKVSFKGLREGISQSRTAKDRTLSEATFSSSLFNTAMSIVSHSSSVDCNAVEHTLRFVLSVRSSMGRLKAVASIGMIRGAFHAAILLVCLVVGVQRSCSRSALSASQGMSCQTGRSGEGT